MKRIIGWLVAMGVLVGLFWWLDESDRLEVTHHRIGEAGEANAALRIVQVSDLHVKGGAVVEEKVIQAINTEDPDILVLTGDMVDHRHKLAALDDFLGQLGKRSEKFAIFGNWEYWGGADLKALRKLYIKHRVQLLVNEAVVVQKGGKRFLLVGLDDAIAGRPDWDRAMAPHAGWKGPILVLAHNPKTVEQWNTRIKQRIGGVAFSGHTHGGQITWFGQPIAANLWGIRCVAGWCQEGEWLLYVSRGIGTSRIPLRVGAQPELAVFAWVF
ncbi:putative Uncharacterized metallophosphoesterase YkuE [uncultured Gammaproteobacteria bacterium]